MNLLSNSCQQTGKKSENGEKGHPRSPLLRLRNISFIIAIQPFYRCRRNALKKYRYCVG